MDAGVRHTPGCGKKKKKGFLFCFVLFFFVKMNPSFAVLSHFEKGGVEIMYSTFSTIKSLKHEM